MVASVSASAAACLLFDPLVGLVERLLIVEHRIPIGVDQIVGAADRQCGIGLGRSYLAIPRDPLATAWAALVANVRALGDRPPIRMMADRQATACRALL